MTLWQCYRDKPVLVDAGVIDNFPGNSASFKFKQKKKVKQKMMEQNILK